MPTSTGVALRQARAIRGLSVLETARLAAISPAYLSRLESDAVKKPSPHVLHQLGAALGIPYADLMRLSGYLVPDSPADAPATINDALFADLSDDERDELLEYLAWYRARQRARARVKPG